MREKNIDLTPSRSRKRLKSKSLENFEINGVLYGFIALLMHAYKHATHSPEKCILEFRCLGPGEVTFFEDCHC